MCGASGSTVASYTYDPYGKVLTATGTMAQTNPLRYRGYYYDSKTELYYLQNRYYDSAIGRFINADSRLNISLGMFGLNQFTYCLNNPVNMVDSNGKKPTDTFPVCLGGNVQKDPLTQNEKYMLEAGAKYNVDPAMIATVIAVEQEFNVDVFDLADVFLAKRGIDTSIGLGQVRVSTAKLVEDKGYIEKSKDRQDRINRLSKNSTNISYVAAYLAYLRDIWIVECPDFEMHPDIWWTVYNTGTTNAHPNPGPGALANAANAYYSYYSWLFDR